jgi:cysteinyl-tRNA synthetase
MSRAELNNSLDIHCGGIDHINIHHTNEIAQSEAAYPDQKFFNVWMHNAFLNIAGGKKMAKSDDNFLTLENAFGKKGINSLVYRFACLQTHYRKPMEYSEEAMKNAENGFNHLFNQVRELGSEKGKVDNSYKEQFLEKINDDMNTPQALAFVHELLKSGLEVKDKLATILDFDKVLGLGLAVSANETVPEEILELSKMREQVRKEKNWAESDRLRDEIQKLGYVVEDADGETRLMKK